MLEWIAELWWLWLILFAVSGTGSGYYLYHRWKHRNDVQAQFLVSAGCMGCIILVFYIMGIISATLSILGFLFRWVFHMGR